MLLLSQIVGFGSASVVPVGFSCTMTAGTNGISYGYDASDYGSISAEPVPAQSCQVITVLGGVVFFVQFAGNIVSTLSGLHVWVDGVDYGAGEDLGAGAGWQYDSIENQTVWGRSTPTLPDFLDGNTYLVEFK